MRKDRLNSVLIITATIGFIMIFLSFISNQMGNFRMDKIPELYRGEQHEVQDGLGAGQNDQQNQGVNISGHNSDKSYNGNNKESLFADEDKLNQGIGSGIDSDNSFNENDNQNSVIETSGQTIENVSSSEEISQNQTLNSGLGESDHVINNDQNVEQGLSANQDQLKLPASSKEILRVGKIWAQKSYVESYGKQILAGINKIRSENNLSEISIDPDLNVVACARAAELCAGQYISHQRYGSAENYTTLLSGKDASVWNAENIAWGYQDVKTTISSWRDNPVYYRNLINETAVRVGFGYCTYTDAKYRPVWILILAG